MDLADVDGRGGGTEKRSLVGNRVGGGGRREESVLSSSRRRMRAGFDAIYNGREGASWWERNKVRVGWGCAGLFVVVAIVVTVVLVLGSTDRPGPAVDTYPIMAATWEFAVPGLTAGYPLLENGAIALDGLEAAIRVVELLLNDTNHSVGYGGSPDILGVTTLDAQMMWGPTHDMGAVGNLKNMHHAITVARAVLDQTDHSLIVGEEATFLAEMLGTSPQNMTTPFSIALWQKWLTTDNLTPNYFKNHTLLTTYLAAKGINVTDETVAAIHAAEHVAPQATLVNHDTVGMVAIDKDGNVGCGVSTNGLTFKVPGRVGDSPIPGAGCYVNNDVGGAAGTGNGDIMMRFLPSLLAVQAMGAGMDPTSACEAALRPILSFYPDATGSLVCLSVNGTAGGASIGWDGFAYSVLGKGMTGASVTPVAPFNK